jgi:uncharacterized protein (DUF885 family)
MKTIMLAAALTLVGCNRIQATTDSARLEFLFDRYFRETLAANPEEASELGLHREAGFDYDRTGFDDISEPGIDEQYRLLERYRRELKSIKPVRLAPAQRIDRKSLLWLLEATIEGRRYWRHRGLLSHLYGVHMQLLSLMTDYHGVQSKDDADDYLSRLKKLPRRLEQARHQIKKQTDEGKLPPKYIIDRTLGSMAEFRNVEAADNMMVTVFREKLAKVEGLEKNEVLSYGEKARQLVENTIYPVYDSLMASARQARERAPDDGGVWTMPEGDKYYRWCLKYYTTCNIDPDQLHEMGMKEVARLQGQARKLLDSMGIRGGSYRDLIRAYWAKQ